MRIAYFGGTFDPPHFGHIAIARAARQALNLDQVLFATVGLQPLKPLGTSASFADRVAMTRLAIQNEPAFQLSLADSPKIGDPSPNYTIDTLTKLRNTLDPGTQLYLLIGADSYRTLRHWHRSSEIPFAAGLVVASRPGYQTEGLPQLAASLPPGIGINTLPGHLDRYRLTNPAGAQAELTLLPNLRYDVSATQLRGQIQGDTLSQPPLDPAVLAYIRHRHLYQS